MDKNEAIRLFIRRYSAKFRLDPFPEKAFKKLKRDFFLSYPRIGVPKDSEIAAEILEGMMSSAQIASDDDLDKILALPFFRKRVRNRDYYHERLCLKSQTGKPVVDVTRIEEAEYARKLRESLKKEAREEVVKEKLQEIEKLELRIRRKKEEYLSIPSILDEEEYPIPEEVESEQMANQEKRYSPWWEELGLLEDPFHGLEGLGRINRELYDQIVHKTEIFIKYESMIEKAPGEFFKNTVVYGQFGSGKTTFFDYIRPILYDHRIYPIYVQLGGEFEVRELIFEFRTQVNTVLDRYHTVLCGQGLPSYEVLVDDRAITDSLKKLAHHGVEGFVVFIDDLHKGELEKAMRFMSYLQVLTSRLRRATDLNIGFVVAGSLEWERSMAHDPKFSGSVDREERMPPLKLDVALDAINRRFKAFARNPDNPRQLEQEFLEKIYRGLVHDRQDITFRRVIREVLNEFEAGHFDALHASPIKISVATLGQIKSILQKNLGLKRQLNKLIYGSRRLKSAQKRRCLELLVSIYLRRRLLESEVREHEVRFLQRLAQTGLITKLIEEDGLAWILSKELQEANKEVIRRFGLSLEDYLSKIYFGEFQKAKRKQKRTLYNEEIQLLNAMISHMKPSLIRSHLDYARRLHLMIIESGDKYLNVKEEVAKIIRRCTESLARLTKAYMAYERLPVRTRISDTAVLSFWKDFWWSPEIIQQFIRASTPKLEDGRRAVPHIVSLYREAFPQILNYFREERQKSRQFHIPLTELKNDEIKLLHECRELWAENKFKELAGNLVKSVEMKLRSFLFNVFTILYGDFDQRVKWLDKQSRQYILTNMKKDSAAGFSVSRNEFQQLNRGQYRNLMTGVQGGSEGRRNWKHIFSTVFPQWTENELDSYLHTFAQINIIISHLKDESIGVREQDRVYGFMVKSTRFMMDINKAYLGLLSSKCFKCEPETYFSLNRFKDSETLTPIEISEEDLELFSGIFLGKDQLRIPLDDQAYLEGIFGLSYRKIFAFLAKLHVGVVDKTKREKLGLEITKRVGCELHARLNRLTGYFEVETE